jgi:F-type H+-transporting ATPase subunit delta
MTATAIRRAHRQARRLFRLCVVDQQLDAARVRAVVRRIVGSRHRGDLAVLAAFQRLVRLDRDRHRAVVEAATILTPDVRDDIGAELARVYGPTLEASFVQTPALIGGVRITVGSDVYDGSVRGRLAAIAGRMGIPELAGRSKA